MVKLSQTIPALPVRNAAVAVAFYRDRFGFQVVHLWEASDEEWRRRTFFQWVSR